MSLFVIYEDNHIIAVYKPAGVLVQPVRGRPPLGVSSPAYGRAASNRLQVDKSGDMNLLDDVKKYLKEKYKKPGNVFLGLVHRLDRNVSGIVLFGKTSKGASRLSEQFRNNEIKKIYRAVVEGVIKPSSGTLVHFLKKDENKKIALVSKLSKPGYYRSELSYKTVLLATNYSLLAISLKTGRFHQIRAQLSAIGCPVAGDKKYGAKSKTPDGSLALCATEVTFRTATGNEDKTIKIDQPVEWGKFFTKKLK